jgi:hypothetical protein
MYSNARLSARREGSEESWNSTNDGFDEKRFGGLGRNSMGENVFVKRGEAKILDSLAEDVQLMASRTASLTKPMAAVRI